MLNTYIQNSFYFNIIKMSLAFVLIFNISKSNKFVAIKVKLENN